MEGRLDLKESPIRTERKTIHLPPDTIQALNKLAARNGTDFSKDCLLYTSGTSEPLQS